MTEDDGADDAMGNPLDVLLRLLAAPMIQADAVAAWRRARRAARWPRTLRWLAGRRVFRPLRAELAARRVRARAS